MLDITISQEAAKSCKADLLVLVMPHTKKQGLFKALDQDTGGHLSATVQAHQFKAKKGQSLLYPLWSDAFEPEQVLLLGAGELPLDTLESWRTLGAQAAKAAESIHAKSLAFLLQGKGQALAKAVTGATLGLELASYQFTQYKSEKKPSSLRTCTLLLPPRTGGQASQAAEAALERAQIIAGAVCAARDLVNEPPNVLTPTEFASRAEAMAEEVGLQCEILDKDALEKEGFRLLLAVGQGSVQEPRLVHLCHRPNGHKKRKTRIFLVGKGVTFDAGGLSLKPSASMLNMHGDMAGAAAVFGAMQAIAQLAPHIEVHGLLSCTENMTGAAAYKLNDVITGHNGKTVEIKNTDAEGRLALADALSYASEQGATHIIDIATLTGACMVALGNYTAGLMSSDEELAESLLKAAKDAGESIWQLPLLAPLRDGLKSRVADLSNIGERWGGAISAALFLKEFVGEDIKWAHLDIAGPAFSEKANEHIPKGGTGFAVATLIQYVLDQA